MARMDVEEDLSTLAWVLGEVGRSLQSVHKALRRHLREAAAARESDVGSVDLLPLRNARTQMHQAAGALELAGWSAPAQALRAGEAALARMIARPALADERGVQALERLSHAVLDLLQRRLAGRPVPAVSLFPQYRAVQQLAGAERIHPADLWLPVWRWAELPPDARALAREPDEAARGAMEALVLALLRQTDGDTLQRMSDLCAELGEGARRVAAAGGPGGAHAARLTTLWQLAAAVFEAQAGGWLDNDVYTKRLASRLLTQLRGGGGTQVPERLALDLLFFCAHARAPGAAPAAPRLAAVRAAWSLEQWPTGDYETQRLGRFDPTVLAQARKRAAGARDAWAAVAEGDLQRLDALGETFTLLADSVRTLFPAGQALGQALEAAAAACTHDPARPAPPLAMEVATAILYLEACVEDGELDPADLQPRVQRLAERVRAAAGDAAPLPLEPWMEELYRRVSDRQTLGSVVFELRATLSEVERHVDQFFRQPVLRELLAPVPQRLSTLRGVLSMLGLDHAAEAVLQMGRDVESLARSEPCTDADPVSFERLADDLGTLGFLIDTLAVQPALARRLYRHDPVRGGLQAVGQAPVPDAATQALQDGAAASPPPDHVPGPEVATPAAEAAEAAAPQEDTELREVFLDEARERLAEARAALQMLDDVPADIAAMTTLRRAFHTLKGSARMVGLRDYGEAAWACEQLYNVRLAQEAAMDPALRELTAGALDDLTAWTEGIALGEAAGHHSGGLAHAAECLRQGGQPPPVSPGPAAPEAVPEAAGEGATDLPPPAADSHAAAVAQAAEPEPEPEPELRPEPEPEPAVPSVADAQPAAEPELAPDLELDLQAAGPEPGPLAAGHLADWLRNLPGEPAGGYSGPAPGAPAADPPVASVAVPEDAASSLPVPPDPTSPPLGLPSLAERVPGLPSAADLDLGAPDEAAGPLPEPELAGWAPSGIPDDDGLRHIGPLRVPVGLFNIFLQEADEQSRRLCTALAEWVLEHPQQPLPEGSVTLAHSLAGNSATVGYAELSALARALEHALLRVQAVGADDDGPAFLSTVAEEIRRLLHQFAAGFLRPVPPELLARLDRVGQMPPPEVPVPLAGPAEDDDEVDDEDPDAVDAPDADLFLIFCEEAEELLPQLHARLAAWLQAPGDVVAAAACMRTLHTLKGGARLAGAMRLGERAHRLEAAIEGLLARETADPAAIEQLLARADAMALQFEDLRAGMARTPSVPGALGTDLGGAADGAAWPAPVPEGHGTGVSGPAPEPPLPAAGSAPDQPGAGAGVSQIPDRLRADADVAPDVAPDVHAGPEADADAAAPGEPAAAAAPERPSPAAAAPAAGGAVPAGIDWARFAPVAAAAPVLPERSGVAAGAVRVRTALLDRLLNNAGEVSIARARLDADMRTFKGALGELTESLDRLRRQLRDIELQAETQMSSRLEAAKAAAQAFDPLEMDRFTRFQELTRFMAESVNDVATLQRTLQRTLQGTEDELALQARLTRELQDDLLRTRMVEFDSLADRLYRTLRQASRDAGKPVRLDLHGGTIEVDRGVLERMVGPFEHLLRNAVAHGIESAVQRLTAGKPAEGRIEVGVSQSGNEVLVEFADDGGGLDLPRIRERAVARGLLAADAPASDAELAQLVFASGFSTAEQVTELAGRGVGLDVVRSEVTAMGGRIEIQSAPGQGTRFRLRLPLTTAVTQVVMLHCAGLHVAVPATLLEVVRRVGADEVAQAYAQGQLAYAGEAVPFFRLSALLQGALRGAVAPQDTAAVVVVRSAAQRVALHVDEVTANQEVVVKNVGPQLARVPGLVGATLLPSGAAALIYNPVALAALQGPALQARARAASGDGAGEALDTAAVLPPLVLVVDDSLTVRRVTERLLLREGYRVVSAKDGQEAVERLARERPAVLLSDIEMPRMDGFDLLRHIRGNPALRELPVIMITSRTAQKHRDLAAALGADHYLGKPYGEDELLALVASHAGAQRQGPAVQ